MKLEWSHFTKANRQSIFNCIELENPRAAIAVDDRIRQRIDSLRQFPESGRPGRVKGTRELVISGTPYIVAYRVAGGMIKILRILHGAQRWPTTCRTNDDRRVAAHPRNPQRAPWYRSCRAGHRQCSCP